MSTATIPAITGVSAGRETILLTRYPSIASNGLGQLLGRLYESIPLFPNGIKLSHLLFVLPTAPIGLFLYVWIKIPMWGVRYTLTTSAIQCWSMLGTRLQEQVDLGDVDQVLVEQAPGQVFYKSADLVLRNAKGETLMRIAGIPHAGTFRRNILEARDSKRRVNSSLATISARGSA